MARRSAFQNGDGYTNRRESVFLKEFLLNRVKGLPRVEKRPINQIWTEFALTTSCHGVPQIERSRTKLRRIFWIAVLTICAVIFCVQLGLLLARFLRYSKIVEIQVENARSKSRRIFWLLVMVLCLIVSVALVFLLISRYLRRDTIVIMKIRFEQVAFPAVTICNLNAYKQSYALQEPTMRQPLEVHEQLMTNPTNAKGRSKRSVEPFKLATTYCHCDSSSFCRQESDAERIINDVTGAGYSRGVAFHGGISQRHVRCACFFKESDEERVFEPCYLLGQWEVRHCSTECLTVHTCNGSMSALEQSDDFPLDCMCRSATPSDLCILQPNEPVPESKVPKKLLEDFGFVNVSGKAAVQQKTKVNLMFAAQRMEPHERANMSYSLEEQMFQCSFAGTDCSLQEDFVLHQDPVYGNCFTFNSKPHNVKQATRPGALHGLRVLWYVNKTDYMPTSEAAGVKIALHNQTEHPFPDTFGYSAPTGFLSSFAVKKQLVEKLSKPFGDCLTKEELDVGQTDAERLYGGRYSMEGCHRTCVQKKLIEVCGCGDAKFLISNHSLVCPPKDNIARDCLDRVHEGMAMGTLEKCPCREPCQQIVFTAAFSTANWPTVAAQATVCKSPGDNCIDDYHDNAAFIELYFEQVNYQKLVEHEAYGFVNLLADFGGYISLFLGISVITVVEFIVFVYELITSGIWKQDERNPVFFVKLNEIRPTAKRQEDNELNYPMFTDHVDMNVSLTLDD